MTAFCTLSITPKYNQLNLSNKQIIESFSFAIHLDFVKPFECSINKDLVKKLLNITEEVMNALEELNFLILFSNKKDDDSFNTSQKEKLDNNAAGGDCSFESPSNSLSSFSLADESQFFDFKSTTSSQSSPHNIIRVKSEQSKINIWIQTTITKVFLNLNDEKDKVKIAIEDITTFVDLNSIYKKVSLKFGSFYCHHYIFNSIAESWELNKTNGGVLVTSLNDLNDDLFILSAKSNVTKSKLSCTDGPALNVTFTSAKSIDFNKKFYNRLRRKQRNGHQHEKEKDHAFEAENEISCENLSDNFKNRFSQEALKVNKNWINEVNFLLKKIDLIYQPSILNLITSVFAFSIQAFEETFFKAANQHANLSDKNDNNFVIPVLLAPEIPLINLEIGKIRIILPIKRSNCEKESQIFILQCLKTNITSNVQNPLNRNIHELDAVYEEAKSSGFLYKPGFCFEDRQYSICLNGISVFMSKLSDLLKKDTSSNLQLQGEGFMNPAAMWNSLKKIDSIGEISYSNSSRNITPIVDIFDFNGMLGLPICFSSSNESRKRNFLAGYLLEVNISNFLNLFVSTTLLNVIREFVEENSSIINEMEDLETKKSNDYTRVLQTNVPILVPLELLITTEKININIYDSVELLQSVIQPLFVIQFYQPFLTTIIKDSSIKFELCIFDFFFDHHVYATTEKNKYIFPIVETKQRILNSKTGMLTSFLSLKYFYSRANIDEEAKEVKSDKFSLECEKCSNFYEFTNCEVFSNNDKKKKKHASNNIVLILFDRHFRFKFNLQSIEKLNKLLNKLDLMNKNEKQKCSNNGLRESNSAMFMEDFIIKINTSQVAINMELIHKKYNFEVKISSIKIDLRVKNHEHSKFETEHMLLDSNIENVSFNLIDNNSEKSLDFEMIRPFVLSIKLKFNFEFNEFYVFLRGDCIYLNINKNIAEIIKLLSETVIEYQNLILENFSQGNQIETKNFFMPSMNYQIDEDDMRNKNFSFFINGNPQDNESKCLRLRLPDANQILINQHNTHDFNDCANVCWRYSEMRAVVFASIQPLSFMNFVSFTKRNDMKEHDAKIKCYLECLNECTNSFEIVKEFCIQNGKFTLIIDVKNSLENIRNHFGLIYSFCWRLRLSKESMGFIDIASVLAASRIDSIVYRRPKYNNVDLIKRFVHFEASLSYIDIKHYTHQKNVETILMKFNDNKVKLMLASVNDNLFVNICLLGKLSVDYIEYRFLTMSPLLEITSFKSTVNCFVSDRVQLEPSVSFEKLSLNLSQSSINALKIIENHWTVSGDTDDKIAKDIIQSNYLIVNDTSFMLHVKQYGTEETVIINKACKKFYFWRTHKKRQLLQLYIPEYKAYSSDFSIDEVNIFELVLDLDQGKSGASFQIVLIITITELHGFQKKITIQGNYSMCNYLSSNINMNISYGFDQNDLIFTDIKSKLEPHSRSLFTYNITKAVDALEFKSIDIYDSNSSQQISCCKNLKCNKLKEGILCFNEEMKIKFWLTFYEQKLKDKNDHTVMQYHLVLCPLLVICSYLPLPIRLGVNSVENRTNTMQKIEQTIEPYSMNHVNHASTDNIFVHFENAKLDSSVIQIHSFVELSVNEYKNVRISINDEHSTELEDTRNKSENIPISSLSNDKVLVHADVFKRINFEFEFEKTTIDQKEALKELKNNSNESSEMGKFNIKKSLCWNFSNTIRLDIHASFLVINKTNYNLKIIKYSNSDKKEYCCFTDALNQSCFPCDYYDGAFKIVITNVASTETTFESEFVHFEDSYAKREKDFNTMQFNRWVDAKVFQKSFAWTDDNVLQDKMSCRYLKFIHLTLQLKHFGHDKYSSKILTIKPKYMIYNKTKLRLQFDLNSSISKKEALPASFDKLPWINADSHLSVAEVYDKITSKLLTPNSFINLKIFSSSNDSSFITMIPSKELVLCDSSLIDLQKQNNSKDPLQVSRQNFCLYDMQRNESGALSQVVMRTRAFTCMQKVCNEEDGSLQVIITECENSIIDVFNDLEKPIYIWPRYFEALNEPLIISNLSIESYVYSLNKDVPRFQNQNDVIFNENMSIDLILVHYVPPKSICKLHVDFIGVNKYPERIKEHSILLFGLKQTFNDTECIIFPKVNSLCKIYDNEHQIRFLKNGNEELLFYYSTNEEEKLRIISNTKNPMLQVSKNHFNSPNIDNKSLISIKSRFACETIKVSMFHDYISKDKQVEILELNCLGCEGTVYQHDEDDFKEYWNINFKAKSLQVDNQLFESDNQNYDFPVIFMPRVNSEDDHETCDSSINNYSILEIDEFLVASQSEISSNSEFLNLELKFYRDLSVSNNYVSYELDLSLKPFEVYLEDSFLYYTIKTIMDLIKCSQYVIIHQEDDYYLSLDPLNNLKNKELFLSLVNNSVKDAAISSDLDSFISPMTVKSLTIGRIDAVVSLRTSYKIHILSYKSPISIERFTISDFPYITLTFEQLFKLLTTHYLTSLLLKTGWLLGSLDFIGSPIVFIQNVGDGIYNLFTLPYKGLKKSGITGLVNGLSSGLGNLLFNVSAGTITSVTSFAAFLSRNLDALSCDPDHLARQETLRHQMPSNFSSGVIQISSSFFISIIGAIGGLAEQPIQSINNSENLIKGFSKGVIGLFTKPIAAFAELINQTGQGFLRVTGANKIPTLHQRSNRPSNIEYSKFKASLTKCIWSIIGASTLTSLHNNEFGNFYIIEAVFTNDEYSNTSFEMSSCYLLLTEEVLFIIDEKEDIQERSYFLADIDISTVKDGENVNFIADSLLIISIEEKNDNKSLLVNYQRDNNERLIDYINQFEMYNHKTDHQYLSNNLVDDNDHMKLQLPRIMSNIEVEMMIDKNYFVCICGKILNIRLLAVVNSPMDNCKFFNVPNMNHMLVDSQKQENLQKLGQKSFKFFVDPRISKDFTRYFKFLKQKLRKETF